MYAEELGWSNGARRILVAVATIALVPCGAVLLAVPARRGLATLPLLVVVTLGTGFVTTFRKLRVTVDAAALTVGFGPFRERLPLDRIVACNATSYRWQEYGGWGIRRSPRRHATLYNVLGDEGRAVRVLLDDGRCVLFSSHDPDAVCRALRAHRPEIRVDANS